MEDSLWAGLTDFQIKTPMGVTAENLAEKFGITREQCDAYAVRSQQRWKKGLNVVLASLNASNTVYHEYRLGLGFAGHWEIPGGPVVIKK